MSNEIIDSKIELIEEQIENLERSGFFTEKEIDRSVASLKTELATLKMAKKFEEVAKIIKNTTFTFEEFIEVSNEFDRLFALSTIPASAITVNNFEVLTPNHITA